MKQSSRNGQRKIYGCQLSLLTLLDLEVDPGPQAWQQNFFLLSHAIGSLSYFNI